MGAVRGETNKTLAALGESLVEMLSDRSSTLLTFTIMNDGM